MRTCPRAGCGGAIDDDGFCAVCGREARVLATTAPTGMPGTGRTPADRGDGAERDAGEGAGGGPLGGSGGDAAGSGLGGRGGDTGGLGDASGAAAGAPLGGSGGGGHVHGDAGGGGFGDSGGGAAGGAVGGVLGGAPNDAGGEVAGRVSGGRGSEVAGDSLSGPATRLDAAVGVGRAGGGVTAGGSGGRVGGGDDGAATGAFSGPATGPDSGPGTAPWSGGASVARSRRASASSRPSGRGRLGAGLVEVPRVPYRDPKAAVLTDPEVPEAKRCCSSCGKEVGRGRDGGPGRVEGFCAHCGHHYSFTPKLVPGEVLHDQYEVLGCLAHGGLGWIYLAADHAVSDRWVVLKGLLDSGDADAMAAAIAERRFLAEVEHPNIVKIHNFVRHEDRASGELVDYIVMEYVGGTSVKDMIKQLRAEGTGTESLPVAQAIAYALEVLPALGYLHGVGLLYCDFKPDNVIQTEEQLKLIDLGAVRRVGDRHSPIYGTIGYQAPEIGTDGPSVASDLYTVGRALAVMSFPFDFRGRYRESLPDPQEQPLLRRHESFHRFLLRAAHRDPEQRFASAEEMAEQLTGVLREVLAQQDGVPRPGVSRQFTPERRAFGTEGGLDVRAAAVGLPVPQVDTSDAAAGFLATAATTGDPDQVVAGLRVAPVQTVEVRLQVVRALIEAGRVGEAVGELDALASPFDPDDPETPAADDWRPGWYRGVAALVSGPAGAERARAAFEQVRDALPGEAAPKLAVAVCAEAVGDQDAAAAGYEVVWRTDHAYVSAAFGLARVLLARGERDAAVRVLHSVPDTSIHHVAAQVAAVRAQLGAARECAGRGGAEALAEVMAAGARLSGLELDVARRAGLTVELLGVALESLAGGGASPAQRLLDCEVSESGLRLGLERWYRQLARLADTPEERIALVDRANAVRPRTLV
ncbi:tetratricopeptide repeat protein [Saccharothrix saharensis]|uniref:serine/threonine-protein kinase n=1 Tax=Saccharothrix saharensis TaxID=571190 RepID=UPI00367F894B